MPEQPSAAAITLLTPLAAIVLIHGPFADMVEYFHTPASKLSSLSGQPERQSDRRDWFLQFNLP